MKKIKILAPVGNFSSLVAASKAKADAIYFGIDKLNMRSHSSNHFSIKDISKITKFCKKAKMKAYLTLNSIIYDEEINLMKEILKESKKQKVDAVIASDLATISHAKKIKLNIHLSTQLNICNLESVRFFSKYASCIVLARELSLEQITYIVNAIKKEKIVGINNKKLQIEIFAHGALCVAISGKCYMSLAKYNFSANRGKCLQPCRRKYKVTEEEEKKELEIDNKYIMSPKDLCILPFLDKIVKSGINILKIEGRARSSDYVYTVVKTYKDALKSIEEKTFSKEKVKKWMKELKTAYNRGFWEGGYYLGKTTKQWSESYGSQATLKKIYIGKATNYFPKIKVCEFLLETGSLKQKDTILILGNKTGFIKTKIKKLIIHKELHKGLIKEKATFKIDERIRKNDKLYILEKNVK